MTTLRESQPPETQGAARRARRRDKTRTELVSAARSLIVERGVAGLRVSDVTERSDIALGSFYSHFTTKEEIVEAVVAESVTAIADAIGDVGDRLDDPAEGMSVGVRRLVGLCQSDPELAHLLVRLDDAEEHFRELLWKRAYRIMERGVASGRFRAHDATLALTIAIAGVFATIRATVDGLVPPEAACDCAAALLRLVGIDGAEATAIAHRELPATS